jgi:hypothetical protein
MEPLNKSQILTSLFPDFKKYVKTITDEREKEIKEEFELT